MGVGTFIEEEESQLLASLCPKPFAVFFVAYRRAVSLSQHQICSHTIALCSCTCTSMLQANEAAALQHKIQD